MKLPKSYWIYKTRYTACTIKVRKAKSQKQTAVVEVDVVTPVKAKEEGQWFDLPVSKGQWNVRDALNIAFSFPKTVGDLGIQSAASVLSTMVMEWGEATGSQQWSSTRRGSNLDLSTPFVDTEMTRVWKAAVQGGAGTLRSKEDVERLSLSDSMEHDPANSKEAMQQERFLDFWLDAEKAEWDGLWSRQCFKKWKRSELAPNDLVFGSRYHYKIKHDAISGKISKFKVRSRLVVMGHCMQEGVDFNDAFAPVPHTTIGRLMMSTAAAEGLHLHSIDLSQAFIQADRLPEGVNGLVFISQPPGCKEDEEGVVYECLRPLYGIPSSARALHVTLTKWFKEQGFSTVGFEDSVWTRPAGGRYQSRITVSAHIDNLLCSCVDLNVLQLLKADFLTRFDGTDDGQVEQYLGCEVVFDRQACTVTLRQKVYAERVLRTYCMWGCATVKTPMEPGTRLSKADSPQHVDPVLHRRYRGIVGHISFLVSCMRPDLAFAYSELSKFVQFPGQVHLKAAERTLQYLMGTYDKGLTYRRLDERRRNRLKGWVDSEYASDPDTSRSVTGYVMSMNGAPLSWKAKRQGCVTLSS
eukprot:3934273-Rhodomonas_salina.1